MAEEEELDINDSTLDKYKGACEIANNTLKALLKALVAGKNTTELCALGNKLIVAQTEKVFKGKMSSDGKPMKKGIAFPVCLSVNDCCGNNCPTGKSESGHVLADGDMVKIDLGVHIDYYCSVVAHTVVIGASEEAKVTGKNADVLMAALNGAQVALKTIQPGVTNTQVTEALKKVSEQYDVNPVKGVLMHQIKHGVIDGNNCILLREEDDHAVEEFEFEAGRIYTVDVMMSTGAGKPIERDAKTTVFKRDLAMKYQLKMQASRALLSDVDNDHAPFPFALSQMKDENKARLGVKECLEHQLLHKFPVLFEKPGDMVAQFKYTVIVLPSGTTSMSTGLPVEVTSAVVSSDKALSPELQEIADREIGKKKKKKAAE